MRGSIRQQPLPPSYTTTRDTNSLITADTSEQFKLIAKVAHRSANDEVRLSATGPRSQRIVAWQALEL
jgi:hypothetical protein